MELADVMAALEKLGTAQTKKTFQRHGATDPYFGVKVADLKVLQKKLKGRQDLALELYATSNLDAMYLAGLIADGAKMSKKELESWVKAARSPMVAEYTVPWVAAEHPDAPAIARKWMDAKQELVAGAGWNTYSSLMMVRPDDELDHAEIERLLERVKKEIPKAQNRVRYCMNSFVIATGASVPALLAKAKATAKAIGVVEVDMHGTACKVPSALEAIAKIEKMGRVGHKRKSTKC